MKKMSLTKYSGGSPGVKTTKKTIMVQPRDPRLKDRYNPAIKTEITDTYTSPPRKRPKAELTIQGAGDSFTRPAVLDAKPYSKEELAKFSKGTKKMKIKGKGC